MDVEQNIRFIQNQIDTYQSLANATDASLSAATVRMLMLNESIAESQAQLRAIQNDLRHSDSARSETELEKSLRLSQSIERSTLAQGRIESVVSELESIALRWNDAVLENSKLPKGQFSESDTVRIQSFETELRSLLEEFDFRSISPAELAISRDGFGVESDGFSVNASISASDNIRLIWAYLISLSSFASTPESMHPGLLVFDEPKQQAVEDHSFDKLLDVLVEQTRDGNQQAIVFTSEPINRLRARTRLNEQSIRDIPNRVLQRAREE